MPGNRVGTAPHYRGVLLKGGVMFTELFESAARIQTFQDGPAGACLKRSESLVRDRYAAITARRYDVGARLNLDS